MVNSLKLVETKSKSKAQSKFKVLIPQESKSQTFHDLKVSAVRFSLTQVWFNSK